MSTEGNGDLCLCFLGKVAWIAWRLWEYLARANFEFFFTLGTAGDSLTQHHGYPFSTKNWNYESFLATCAELVMKGYWADGCSLATLKDDVFWYHWKGYHRSVKRAEMKIRPWIFRARELKSTSCKTNSIYLQLFSFCRSWSKAWVDVRRQNLTV